MKKLITKPLKVIAIGALALSFNAFQVASATETSVTPINGQLQIEDMGHLAYIEQGELQTQLPVSTSVLSRISDESVSVEVTQTFINHGESDIEAEYFFPSPEYAQITDFNVSNGMPCEEVSYTIYLEKDLLVTVSYQYEMDLEQLELAQKHIPNILGFQAVSRLDEVQPQETEVADLVAQN